MKKKIKLIIFFIIVVISVGGLVFKGYFSNEVYVLNSSEELNAGDENLESTENENIVLGSDDLSEDESSIKGREVTIYISGEVKNPGVVTIASDKRLADAVEKLGGVTEKADMDNINLAQKLEDEMHYIVPKKGSKAQLSSKNNNDSSKSYNDSSYSSNSSNNSSYSSNSSNNSSYSSSKSEGSGKININTADISELDKIPGVGEATANKILNYRKENGNFKNTEEIKNVNGIGDKKYENMKDSICVD